MNLFTLIVAMRLRKRMNEGKCYVPAGTISNYCSPFPAILYSPIYLFTIF